MLATVAVLLASIPFGSVAPTETIECRRDDGYAATALPGSAAGQYAPQVGKTFFAYLAAKPPTASGSTADDGPIRLSYLDQDGTVPKPVVLRLPAGFSNVNSVWLTIDEAGLIWVCAGSGAGVPSVIFKGVKPYEVGTFVRVTGPTLVAPRLWHIGGHGSIMVGLQTTKAGMTACFATSPDGLIWSEPHGLAAIDAGQTLVAARQDNKIGVAMASYVAGERPADATNLYYLETSDAGKNWQTVTGIKLDLPVKGREEGLLVWDYRSAHWLVGLADLNFSAAGRPVILYLNGQSLVKGGPVFYTWTTAQWTNREWNVTGLIAASDASDPGLLYLDARSVWRLLIARNGPPPANRPESVALWVTDDHGRSWQKQADIDTGDSGPHALVRIINAGPEARALWSWGQSRLPTSRPASTKPAATKPASSAPAGTQAVARLLLVNGSGDAVRLPAAMNAAQQKPETGPVAKHRVVPPRPGTQTQPG